MSESKKARVARIIRADIEAGRLRDGEVLPATQNLAEKFEVSAFTISSAMDLLEDQGLVVSHVGSRRTVQAPQVMPPRPPKRPQLVLVGGYAGSGKTETGRVIARATGWPILDKDTISRPLVEALLAELGSTPHDRESRTYLDHVRPMEYEALTAALAENLEVGVSLIATAPFTVEMSDQAWMNRTRAQVAEAGGDLTVLWVRTDIPTMLTYLRRRGAARDTAKLAEWKTYSASLDIDFTPQGDHIVIDNSAGARPLSEQVAAVLGTQ